ncbi:MAG: glycosyltransferase family 4 protein [Anaerolineae bacterium]
MRVLMISKACVVGAYQRKIEELAKFEDVELTLIVPPYWLEKGRKIPLERVHTSGYELLVEPMALNGHFHLHFYPGLRNQAQRFKPDIMHIDEEPYNLATFQAIRLSKKAGARALFFTWQNLLRRYPPPFSWMERYNLENAAYAIAGNQEGKEVLRAKGFRGRVAVIPQFGVDPEIYKPHAHQKREAGFCIGYIGRLVEEKGVDLLLHALSDLPGEWRLRILGSGPQKGQLQSLVQELGLKEQVAFDSPIPSPGMPDYYRGLDLLVLPSRTRPHWKEQFGRVLIEAMATGVPVVGSDSGEIPHVIGDAGLIFPEDDALALRGAIEKIGGDERLRQRLAQTGRERVLERYTQAQIALETYQVYQEIK